MITSHKKNQYIKYKILKVVVDDYDITAEDENPKEFRTEITDFIQHEEFVLTE